MNSRVPNNNIKQEDFLPLKESEVHLIYLMRKVFRFGNLDVVVRDGLPVDVIQTVRKIRLPLSPEQIDELG